MMNFHLPIALFVAVNFFVSLTSKVHGEDETLFIYQPIITAKDRVNSRGEALTDPVAILIQERVNTHKNGEGDDPYFTTPARRAEIPAMISRGDFSQHMKDVVLNGDNPVLFIVVERDAAGAKSMRVAMRLRDQDNFDETRALLEADVEGDVNKIEGSNRSRDLSNGNEDLYELIDSESNLREGPGANYRIIRRSQNGEVGRALGSHSRWKKLEFAGGEIAWVHDQNLRPSKKLQNARTNEPANPDPDSPPPPNFKDSTDQKVSSLSEEIAQHWKLESDDEELPKPLPPSIVEQLESLVPFSQINLASPIKGSHPKLTLAYALHSSMHTKPLDMGIMADLLEQGRQLNANDIPWINGFSRIVSARKAKSIQLQKQALEMLNNGDFQAAESRLADAEKEFPSSSYSAHLGAFSLLHKLMLDPALRAVDGDWKKPSLMDKDLISKVPEHIPALRAANGSEVLPELRSMIKGLDAALLLGKFTIDYEPAGSLGVPNPIRALKMMRNSETYRSLLVEDSLFTKPFFARMTYLNQLIGPKVDHYENLIDQGRQLEKDGKYLKATTIYRQALGIEYSRELEQTIFSCEEKLSGL